MKNDHPEIPYGLYCCDCPHRSFKKELPRQYNGYCDLLGKSDLDLCKEYEMHNCDTGEIISGDDLPFPISLIWDGCKECEINMEDPSEDD